MNIEKIRDEFSLLDIIRETIYSKFYILAITIICLIGGIYHSISSEDKWTGTIEIINLNPALFNPYKELIEFNKSFYLEIKM